MREPYYKKAWCPRCGLENVSYVVVQIDSGPADWNFRCEECSFEDSGRGSRPAWIPIA